MEIDGYFLEYYIERAGDFDPLRFFPKRKTAMVSLFGRRHNKSRPGRMRWRAKAEDCRPRGAGTRSFASIKAYLCCGSLSHLIPSTPHAGAGDARSRAISRRMSWNICRSTATSAI
jgi:hypothetical protein